METREIETRFLNHLKIELATRELSHRGHQTTELTLKYAVETSSSVWLNRDKQVAVVSLILSFYDRSTRKIQEVDHPSAIRFLYSAAVLGCS